MAMKIATVTPLWNDEQFVLPHFRMLDGVDEKIVLYSGFPFTEYYEKGLTGREPDRTLPLLLSEFPDVRIIGHREDKYGGPLLNLGLEEARRLGCDVMLKIDVDMLMSKKDWARLISFIRGTDVWGNLVLDYKKCTTVYKRDFEHGVTCSIFPVGNDPIAIRTNEEFVNDGVRVIATGHQAIVNWDDFMIHHFNGFGKRTDDAEIARVESLQGFTAWAPLPEEIRSYFHD